MSENWSAQVSLKTPAGTLINLRGERGEHVEAQLSWVIENAPRIIEAEKAFAGAANVAQTLGGAVIEQQASGWAQSQQKGPSFAPAAPQGGGKMCAHGAMTYREGVGAKGPWKGYFCPTAKGTPGQCSPEFIR